MVVGTNLVWKERSCISFRQCFRGRVNFKLAWTKGSKGANRMAISIIHCLSALLNSHTPAVWSHLNVACLWGGIDDMHLRQMAAELQLTTRYWKLESSILTTRYWRLESSILTIRYWKLESSILTTRYWKLESSILTTKYWKLESIILTTRYWRLESIILTTRYWKLETRYIDNQVLKAWEQRENYYIK